MKILVLFGPPGGGKGTQAEKIAQTYGYKHLSTGDIFRALSQTDSPLAIKLKETLGSGKLVSDDLVVEIVTDALKKQLEAESYFIILDGFPRTIEQYRISQSLFEPYDVQYIHVSVDHDELIKRLLERGKTSNRADDNLETIKLRLDVYHKETAPILNELGDNVHTISNDGKGIEEVWFEVQKILGKKPTRHTYRRTV